MTSQLEAPMSTSEANSAPGVVGLPHLFLRIEALALLVASSWIYQVSHGSWALFAALFFFPDFTMLGYLLGPRIGSVCYNLAHTTALFGTIGAVGYVTNNALIIQIGLIGLAHVGFDRLLGYGLKYPEAFGLTHLGRVGKRR